MRVIGWRRETLNTTIADQTDQRGRVGDVQRAERGDLVLRPEEQQDREDQQAAPAPVPGLEARSLTGAGSWASVAAAAAAALRRDGGESAMAECQALPVLIARPSRRAPR